MKSPQLIVDSRMLYFGWVPADPEAVDALVPDDMRALPDRRVYLNQYVVESAEQTIDFGKYSLSYAGIDVEGLDVAEGLPARWWTHYMSTNDEMTEYARGLGIPATMGGSTVLDLKDGTLVATSYVDGRAVIRTTAEVGAPGSDYLRSHIRYVTKVGSEVHGGLYGAVGQCAEYCAITKLEFLDSNHDLYALRPKDPLEIVWGYYFPKATICYPGGLGPLTAAELQSAKGA